MTESSHPEIRLEELLSEQTDRALTYNETAEVRKLLSELPDWHEDDLELAAAATLLAVASSMDDAADFSELPSAIRERVSQQAREAISRPRDDDAGDTLVEGKLAALERDDTIKKNIPEISATKADPGKVASLSSRRALFAVLAVAASIAIAILGYVIWASRAKSEEPAIASLREQLLKEAKDTITLGWSAASDPLGAEVKGDVVWSQSRQSGFMRFRGLAKNDAMMNQYQLWIFDGERDERFPVDGGVFDIDQDTGDVIVKIDPKIRVTKATLFAVTVERPGGVVVSSRERLVVLAKVL